MSIYLINGPSGTGKTSIGNELQKRGYKVIDTDQEFGYYADLNTEAPVKFPGELVTEAWYSQYGWIWDSKKVEKTLNEAHGMFFLCGGALNESPFYPRFDKIFRLIVDPVTMKKRLRSRKGDEHTNNPKFIARMLDFRVTAEDDAHKMGWVVINTSHKTVSESVDEILSYVK